MADPIPVSRPFPFLSLPPELRIKIYRDCIGDPIDKIGSPEPVQKLHCGCCHSRRRINTAYQHAELKMNLYYPLLATCHQIRLEATPVFDNHGQCISSISQAYAFLRSIRRSRRAQLRRLSFSYHLSQSWSCDKLADLELVTKCFRLIAKDCHNLQKFVIYINEGYLRAYAGYLPLSFDVMRVPGIQALRSIRGIKKVNFAPTHGKFSEYLQPILNEFAIEMMQSKKDKLAVKGRGQDTGNQDKPTHNRPIWDHGDSDH